MASKAAPGGDSPVSDALPSRWVYAIEPSMADTRGVAIILMTLLEATIDQEQGVIERRDPEFLHDYRVAVRRTRSALTLFRGVLTPARHRRGRKLFGDLGRRTGAARDLDVLSEALPGYFDVLSEAESPGALRLEREIAMATNRQYAALRRWLEGKTYRRAMISWRSDLGELAAMPGVDRIEECAVKAIGKAASRAFRQFERLRSGGSDAIHRLRIRFKKLRYALEFSGSLTPGGEIASLIKALKAFQDQLGTFQDLEVQRRRIGELCCRRGQPPAFQDLGRRLAESLRDQQFKQRASIVADAERFQTELRIQLERALAAVE